jgi:hypothetical protein
VIARSAPACSTQVLQQKKILVLVAGSISKIFDEELSSRLVHIRLRPGSRTPAAGRDIYMPQVNNCLGFAALNAENRRGEHKWPELTQTKNRPPLTTSP